MKVSVQNGDRTDAYGGSGAPATRVRVAVSLFNNAADIQRMLSQVPASTLNSLASNDSGFSTMKSRVAQLGPAPRVQGQ